jgi:preprotein translocase subunit SecY
MIWVVVALLVVLILLVAMAWFSLAAMVEHVSKQIADLSFQLGGHQRTYDSDRNELHRVQQTVTAIHSILSFRERF